MWFFLSGTRWHKNHWEMHSRSPWGICPWWAQRGGLWPLQAMLCSFQCLWFHLSLQKMRLCLSERKHDPTVPSAQEEVWLCRRKVRLRASSVRWQLLLLGLRRRPLAEPGGVHLNSAGSNDPSEHGWPPMVPRLMKHWALSPEEISFLPTSGSILKAFPFRKSLFQSRGVHMSSMESLLELCSQGTMLWVEQNWYFKLEELKRQRELHRSGSLGWVNDTFVPLMNCVC